MPEKIYSKSPFRANRHRAPGTLARRRSNFRRTALFASLALSLILVASCSRQASQAGGTAPESAGAANGEAQTLAAASGAAGSSGQPASAAKSAAPADAAAGGTASPVAGGSSAQGATGGSAAAPAGPYVSFVTGTVTGARPTGDSTKIVSTPAKLRVADSIERGELVQSAKSSAAEVRIGSEFDIGIGEETTVRFDSVAGAGKGPDRLTLHLEKGTLQIKAGAALIDGSLTGSTGAGGRPLLLEVHTPLLFVSSRGGSMLLSAQPDNDRAAVGLGQAWILPQSVVYSDLVGKLHDESILKDLDTILSKALPVSRHEELSVTSSQLTNIDRVGSSLRSELKAVLAAKPPTAQQSSTVASLTTRASGEVQSALGKPKPLSASLQKQLDPSMVTQPKMKTTSVSESSSSKGTSAGQSTQPPSAGSQGSAGAGASQPAQQPTSSAPGGQAGQLSPPSNGQTGQGVQAPSTNSVQTGQTGQGSSQAAAPPSQGSTTTSNAPVGSRTTSKSSSSGNAAVGRAVLDALDKFFNPTPSSNGAGGANGTAGSSAGGASSSGGASGAGSSGGFSGPTPPTPPTPPTAP